MGRELDTTGIKDLLYRNYDHPRWDEVAERCLTCGNCTMVCPTCFCTTVEDVTDLAGEHVERHQKLGFVLHGRLLAHPRRRGARLAALALPAVDDAQAGELVGPVRQLGLRRLRRCITWCPVGIDLTEEARAIRDSEERSGADD